MNTIADLFLALAWVIPVILQNFMKENDAAFIFLFVAFCICKWAFNKEIEPARRFLPMLLPAGYFLLFSVWSVLKNVVLTFSIVDTSIIAYICAYCLITLLVIGTQEKEDHK